MIMSPKMWRLLISASLRLFLSLTAVEHGVLLVGLLVVGISMLVPAPKGSPAQPFTAAEHEARFTHELSTRVSEKTCAEIVAMSRDLDRLDPRWLCGALSQPVVTAKAGTHTP